ncbi:MAG: hypothetical protein RL385_5559, partial [Pseudomonadota bacterium]
MHSDAPQGTHLERPTTSDVLDRVVGEGVTRVAIRAADGIGREQHLAAAAGRSVGALAVQGKQGEVPLSGSRSVMPRAAQRGARSGLNRRALPCPAFRGVALELAIEGSAVHAQQLGGTGLVVVEELDDAQDVAALDLVEGENDLHGLRKDGE